MRQSLGRYFGEDGGAITAFFAILFPVLLLIGGLATDRALMNAQKRYVQSQADLAAQSAARYLPNPVEVRRVARKVVASNPVYADLVLSDRDIEIGHYDPQGGFTPLANQNSMTGASAVRVTVRSPYEAILLKPLLSEHELNIKRSAVAAQRAVVVFTLRNRLLSLNTRESVLDYLLGPLGLGVTLNVLGYEGLANARVKVEDLLGLVTVGTAVELLTFDEVLDLPITLPVLLPPLMRLAGFPGAFVDPAVTPSKRITLREVLAVSPTLLRLPVGNVLPNLSVNAFDLVMVLLGLAGDENKRLNVGAGINLSPLADVELALGLIAPPKIGMGRIGDTPPPTAVLSQVNAFVSANLLGDKDGALLRLNADLRVGNAEASAMRLNCAASEPSDTLAVFSAKTAPLSLDLNLGLLVDSSGAQPESLDPVSIAGRTQEVTVSLSDFRKPVLISNPLSLAGVVKNLGDVLRNLRDDLLSNKVSCTGGILGALLCPLVTLINHTLAALLTIVSAVTDGLSWLLSILGVDQILNALLRLLGIDIAQAELILDDYSCASVLIE